VEPDANSDTSFVLCTNTARLFPREARCVRGQSLGPAVQDRLGSVGKYYPFGEDRNTTYIPADQVKFATYTRDSATSLDYADQRYYVSTFGRFMTADPYQGSGGPKEPGSWNRYGYSMNDPVNFLTLPD
jgi:RHS repeat-associated protein